MMHMIHSCLFVCCCDEFVRVCSLLRMHVAVRPQSSNAWRAALPSQGWAALRARVLLFGLLPAASPSRCRRCRLRQARTPPSPPLPPPLRRRFPPLTCLQRRGSRRRGKVTTPRCYARTADRYAVPPRNRSHTQRRICSRTSPHRSGTARSRCNRSSRSRRSQSHRPPVLSSRCHRCIPQPTRSTTSPHRTSE